jgi:hypothetical protein
MAGFEGQAQSTSQAQIAKVTLIGEQRREQVLKFQPIRHYRMI